MKAPLRWIFNIVDDVHYLAKQRCGMRRTLQLFAYYCKLAFLSMFAWKARPTSIAVCGYTVRTFSARTLFFLFREIFIHGEYHFKLMRERPVIYDLGANIGIATIYFKWLYPNAVIYAYEPDPETYALLKQNIESNKLHDVHTYNIAIGSKEGTVDFFTNAASSGSLRMSVGRKRAEGKSLTVPMKTLSPFLKPNAILKIDTEGSETETVRELCQSKKIDLVQEMVIEYHRINSECSKLAELLTFIEKSGFEYQFECANKTLVKKDVYQNVMLYCYRR